MFKEKIKYRRCVLGSFEGQICFEHFHTFILLFDLIGISIGCNLHFYQFKLKRKKERTKKTCVKIHYKQNSIYREIK